MARASLGDDGEVGVDYYRITDVKRGGAQIIAPRGGKETVADSWPYEEEPPGKTIYAVS